MRWREETVFSLILLVVAGVFVFESLGYNARARLVPLVAGVPALTFAFLQFIQDLSGRKWGAKASTKLNIEYASADKGEAIVTPFFLAKERNAIAWILGFFIGMWLLGFAVGIPLFAFLYTKVRSKESWPLSITITFLSWLLVYGLFTLGIQMPLYKGLLFIR